jgi:hypothetical protein
MTCPEHACMVYGAGTFGGFETTLKFWEPAKGGSVRAPGGGPPFVVNTLADEPHRWVGKRGESVHLHQGNGSGHWEWALLLCYLFSTLFSANW